MGRNYTQKDIKLLWGLSAARCAYPDCQQECVIEATADDVSITIGKIAHMVAHSDDGPRADPTMPQEARDSYDNLLLLCGNHHDEVDGQPNTFTVDDLKRWKADQEAWVRDRLTEAIPEITSAELEVISQAIAAAPMPADASFELTAPAEKMMRNGLTDRVTFKMRLGLAARHEVVGYLQDISNLDAAFPERLKAGFVKLYDGLRSDGLEGDALFEALHERACSGFSDFKRHAAALAVLTYLFEACEVFER